MKRYTPEGYFVRKIILAVNILNMLKWHYARSRWFWYNASFIERVENERMRLHEKWNSVAENVERYPSYVYYGYLVNMLEETRESFINFINDVPLKPVVKLRLEWIDANIRRFKRRAK